MPREIISTDKAPQAIGTYSQAVKVDNTVYISKGDRLKTLSVNKVYASGDDVFLSGGINPGDLLITTRLVDPLENSALKIMNRE